MTTPTIDDVLAAAQNTVSVIQTYKGQTAPPTAQVITSFAASATSIQAGQSVTLSWSVSGATAVRLNGAAVAAVMVGYAVTPAASTVYTLEADGPLPTVTKTLSITVAAPQQPPTSGPVVTFTEGVPARVNIAAYLPAGADRYHGGWEVQVGGFVENKNIDYLPGVYFDRATKDVVYTGAPMSANTNTTARTPNSGYYAGAESGPYNTPWTFPPTQTFPPAPKVINGVMTAQSICGGSKHTRMVFCPLDGKMYNMGGDYSAPGYPTLRGGQDGRMVWWRYDPRTEVWDTYYPKWGKQGDQVPLQPDRMNWDFDPVRKVFWCGAGSVRMGPYGYAGNKVPAGAPDPLQYWKGEGGIADAVPEVQNADPLPTLIYDPVAQTMRYACANPVLNAPWVQSWNTCMQSSAFHAASRRWYVISASGNGLWFAWLDTSPTDPTQLKWQTASVDLTAGAAGNLTGATQYHVYNIGRSTPLLMDDTKNVIYMLHSGSKYSDLQNDYSVANIAQKTTIQNQAILGLTLPGHPLGAHKVILVSDLSTALGYDMGNAPTGAGMGTTSPFIFVPEHRAIVLMLEPSEEMVGPWSRSLTIDVDTGAVRDGPRFPDSDVDGMPWFPDAGFWYPPTQELILYGVAIMRSQRVGGNRSWDKSSGGPPMAMLRYRWT